MITIRPYDKKDYRYVQQLGGGDESYVRQICRCALYCNYYVDCEPQFCFVAVDENDLPVGYVLAAADLDNFYEKMQQDYLPVVRKLAGSDYYRYSAEMKVTQRYTSKGYTAHLVIFVDEQHRNKGVGSRLLAELLQKLRQSYVEGVHFVCGSKQEDVKNLLVKNGFEDIDYLSGCIVYGQKLYSEE